MYMSTLGDLGSYSVPKKVLPFRRDLPDRRGAGVARTGLNAQLPLGAAW